MPTNDQGHLMTFWGGTLREKPTFSSRISVVQLLADNMELWAIFLRVSLSTSVPHVHRCMHALTTVKGYPRDVTRLSPTIGNVLN